MKIVFSLLQPPRRRALRTLALWGGLCLVAACVPVAQQGSNGRTASGAADKRVRFENHVYDPGIHTVLLYPTDGGEDGRFMLQDPVVLLGDDVPLRLEFDELGNQFRNYYVRLIHCNGDWTKSILNDIEFLDQYNQFLIDDYEISINTRLPYLHYRFRLPRVKVSGNYLLLVFRENDEKDVVLTRRFVVYEDQVNVRTEVKFSTGIPERPTHQQVDFEVYYPRFDMVNPQLNVRAVVRQNGRWDNALQLKPLFFDPNERTLDYRYFNLENNFLGLNEYRNMDLRSIRFQGLGVGRVVREDDRVDMYMQPDLPRRQSVYAQLIDINGRLVIENFEQRRGAAEADYVYTHFELRTPPVEGEVYVFGQLSNWETRPETRLTYDADKGAYEGVLLLKQGYYNYSYAWRKPDGTLDESYFEGSYNITENRYDVLIYYRNPATRADRVVGYEATDYFGRN